MNTPNNPTCARLRIEQQHAKRIWDKAIEQEYLARRRWEEVWMAYVSAMWSVGWCAGCDKPMTDCKCVLMAAQDKIESSTAPEVAQNVSQQ